MPYTGRTPHIHFKVKKNDRDLLTTQCYVKGDPGNERDFLWKAIRDEQARNSITVDFTQIKESKIGELAAKFDVVMGITPKG